MSRLTRDGTAEPVSRDQILRCDHEQDWQPFPVDPYSCYMCDHTLQHHKYLITFFVKMAVLLEEYMYAWSSHRAYRVRINRARLPILLVVSGTGKMNISLSPFAPENFVSRDAFGSPVPSVSACTSACSG